MTDIYPPQPENEARRLQAIMDYESVRKKGLATWLLWLFLGSFGVHRYYLGDVKQGIFMTIAGLCAWIPGLLWCLIDGFYVNRRIRTKNGDAWKGIAARSGVAVEPIPESAQ